MKAARAWMRLAPGLLPVADRPGLGLPALRLLRLSLFQVSGGMATVLLLGTLNRVMILELGVAATLVSTMVALPLVFAPLRALVGFRSDTHRSVLGWRRVPYLWFGTLLQFGGLAIMPFALILLSGDTRGPHWLGAAASALAFLLAGAGLQVTQTAGLALAADLAEPRARPRVVALMYAMLLLGMCISALVFGLLLADFSALRLIQVVQGAALATLLLNLVALWKQEARDPARTAPGRPQPGFNESWRRLAAHGRARRFLVALGLGTAAFGMQDIILEPYGGEVLHLPVGATTLLTALMAFGALAAFVIAARHSPAGGDAHRLSATGALVGIVAFAAVIFADPLGSAALFRAGAVLIGFGAGLFAVGTLQGAMNLDAGGLNGLALGAWGAVQATAAGLSVAAGGAIRDAVSTLAAAGALGPALSGPGIGYSVVYHLELGLLFATLVALGPLARTLAHPPAEPPPLAEPAR